MFEVAGQESFPLLAQQYVMAVSVGSQLQRAACIDQAIELAIQ